MSITIAGQPVLIDHDGSLEAWLDAYLKTCDQDQFWQPETELRSSGFSLEDDQLFESNLPELPRIKLGCIQWPAVGCYRFARGMFAVDRVAFRVISEAAWGYLWDVGPPVVPPVGWTQGARNTVDVVIDVANSFALKMHVLPPIKVTDDCWIIRLVDMRYYQRASKGPYTPAATWQTLIASSASRYNVLNISNPAAVGYTAPPVAALTPDGAFFRSRTVPESLLLDAAIFSLGWRPLVPCRQTSGSVVDVVAQAPTAASLTRAALLTASNVTGGASTIRTRAQSLLMTFHQAWSHHVYGFRRFLANGTLDQKGPDLSTQCTLVNQVQIDSNGVHTSEPNILVLSSYANYIFNLHGQANGWNQFEYWVAFAGLVEIIPGAHDDYIEWDCSPNGPITRVKSLLSTFIPRCFFVQHPIPSTPAAETAWWFATHSQTMAAIALDDEDGGMWDEENEAWEKRFVNIQLVDSALLLPGATPSAKLAFAGVKALIARKQAIKAGESLIVHFVNQIVFYEVPGAAPGDPPTPVFEVFRGWVIGETANNCREVIFSCEGVDEVTDAASPYAGKFGASGTVIWATEPDLIGTEITAYDHWCILDLEAPELEGIRMIASWGVTESSASGATGEKTPYHWALTDRCCE